MEVEIGHVTHYYNHLNVAVLSLEDSLKVGDTIHFLGHVTDFDQKVSSMEVEHHSIVWARPGDEIAIKVVEPVREHDLAYRVIEESPEPQLS